MAGSKTVYIGWRACGSRAEARAGSGSACTLPATRADDQFLSHHCPLSGPRSRLRPFFCSGFSSGEGSEGCSPARPLCLACLRISSMAFLSLVASTRSCGRAAASLAASRCSGLGKWALNTTDVECSPRLPALLELDPRDALKDVDAIRDDADDHKRIALGEKLLGCPFKGCSEALDSP